VPDTAVLGPRAAAVGPPWLSYRCCDCVRVVRLSVSGEPEIATAPQLDRALGCAQSDAAVVILGLRELEFMDSSGAHRIVAADGRPRQAAARRVVVRP
jgi:anti-anti-sigma regulatory factor